LLFNFALALYVSKAKGSNERLEFYGTYQILVSADDFNVVDKNMNVVKH
jgi:hypothetical protein